MRRPWGQNITNAASFALFRQRSEVRMILFISLEERRGLTGNVSVIVIILVILTANSHQRCISHSLCFPCYFKLFSSKACQTSACPWGYFQHNCVFLVFNPSLPKYTNWNTAIKKVKHWNSTKWNSKITLEAAALVGGVTFTLVAHVKLASLR